MSQKRIFAAALVIMMMVSAAAAQRAEVTISLNEVFFNALLDSVFDNFEGPSFPIAQNSDKNSDREVKAGQSLGQSEQSVSFINVADTKGSSVNPACDQSIRVLREMSGVRTAVRFREGKINVPLAFTGSYAPPFIGCVEFAGWADTTIDLEFDQNGQRLIGRAHVNSVNLNGTGGMGGTVIAKMLQSSLDRKLNPIEIMRLEKLSFGVPIQNSGSVRLKAVAVRPDLLPGVLNLNIVYEFLKG